MMSQYLADSFHLDLLPVGVFRVLTLLCKCEVSSQLVVMQLFLFFFCLPQG